VATPVEASGVAGSTAAAVQPAQLVATHAIVALQGCVQHACAATAEATPAFIRKKKEMAKAINLRMGGLYDSRRPVKIFSNISTILV
jgi:hypothetical protein